MNSCLVGVDIGGTKLAAVVADTDGQILNKVRQPTESHKGFEYAIKLIFDMIDQLLHLEQFTRSQVSSIGISCGGPLDTQTGVVYSLRTYLIGMLFLWLILWRLSLRFDR